MSPFAFSLTLLLFHLLSVVVVVVVVIVVVVVVVVVVVARGAAYLRDGAGRTVDLQVSSKLGDRRLLLVVLLLPSSACLHRCPHVTHLELRPVLVVAVKLLDLIQLLDVVRCGRSLLDETGLLLGLLFCGLGLSALLCFPRFPDNFPSHLQPGASVGIP